MLFSSLLECAIFKTEMIPSISSNLSQSCICCDAFICREQEIIQTRLKEREICFKDSKIQDGT